jgi:hypothetical protein
LGPEIVQHVKKQLKEALVSQFPQYDLKLMLYWATKSTSADLRCNNRGRQAEHPAMERLLVAKLTSPNSPLFRMKARHVRTFIINLATSILRETARKSGQDPEKSPKMTKSWLAGFRRRAKFEKLDVDEDKRLVLWTICGEVYPKGEGGMGLRRYNSW